MSFVFIFVSVILFFQCDFQCHILIVIINEFLIPDPVLHSKRRYPCKAMLDILLQSSINYTKAGLEKKLSSFHNVVS